MIDSPRFRIVAGLRRAADIAERIGGRVQVVDVTGTERRVIDVSPQNARLIADEFERRWAS